MKEKILFLTTEIPYPLDSGGKIRSFNMLKSLYEKYEIDLLCFSEGNHKQEHISELNKLCKSVYVIKKIYKNSKSKSMLLKNVFLSVFKNKPFVVEKFYDKKYKYEIRRLLSEKSYKAIIVDHLQVAGYIDDLSGNNVILSQHNCEFIILKRRFEKEKNVLKRLYLYIEYKKTQKYEKYICRQVDSVIMLSNEDKNFLIDSSYKGANITIIPISIEADYIKETRNERLKNILFLGTMSWFPNEQGILWFLEKAWPKIKQENKELVLYIVGSNPSKEVISYSSEEIIVTGYVENVNEYIEKCDACIVPLFIGGGMRVKILECMVKGIPCISTTVGAEGIEYSNNKNIIIADNEEEFKMAIRQINDVEIRKNMVESAKSLIEKKYSLKVITKKLEEIIEK